MPVNDTTANRSYQKPNIANTLSDDVGRLRSALDAIDTDMASKAPSAGPTFTGVTTVAAGSAAAPSLTFTGATSDTGLYSPGADQVAISTAGTGRVFVDASGNVGIGASPLANSVVINRGTEALLRLQSSFSGGTGSDGALLSIDSSNQGYLWNYENASFLFGTNNTERLRINSAGQLLVGTSAARNNLLGASRTAQIQLESASSNSVTAIDGATISALAGCATTPAVAGALKLGRFASDAVGGTAAVSADDSLGTVQFLGADGTNFIAGAFISAAVDGTPGANDMPTRLVFSTTADGAATPTERMRISQDGAVKIAGDNFQIATSKTPASATAAGTTGQIAWDANYIYVCTATNTWKRTAIATW